MPSSSAIASSGNSRLAAAMFSRRCATDDVPGISTVVADRRNNQASATCCALAPSRAATLVSVSPSCSVFSAAWPRRRASRRSKTGKQSGKPDVALSPDSDSLCAPGFRS